MAIPIPVTDLADIERKIAGLVKRLNGPERLRDYITQVSPHLPPPRHIEPIIGLIERARHTTIRACVSMPPRHAKSTTLLHGIAWWLRGAPGDTCAYASYSDTRGKSKSRLARRLALRSGIELMDDAANLGEWRTTAGGGLLAGGVGGGLTGEGISGMLFVDDPIKNRKEADSGLIRDERWEWFNEVAFTRLENASVIVNATRWHDDDVIGRLEKQGGWEIVNLPAIAEAGDPLGRAPGDALWPERYGIPKLEAIRKQLGEWSFSALYQGQPRPRGTTIFQGQANYDPDKFDPKGMRAIVICDPAASTKTTSDYSVIGAAAIEGKSAAADRPDSLKAHIIDWSRGQWTIPDLVGRLRQMSYKNWNAPIGVEAVGGFKAVPQMLRALDPNLTVFEVPAVGDKFQRAQPAAAAWNAGRILIPTRAEWVAPLLRELHSFTGQNDQHDDQVDTLSHIWNTVAMVPRTTRGAIAQPGRFVR